MNEKTKCRWFTNSPWCYVKFTSIYSTRGHIETPRDLYIACNELYTKRNISVGPGHKTSDLMLPRSDDWSRLQLIGGVNGGVNPVSRVMWDHHPKYASEPKQKHHQSDRLCKFNLFLCTFFPHGGFLEGRHGAAGDGFFEEHRGSTHLAEDSWRGSETAPGCMRGGTMPLIRSNHTEHWKCRAI